MKTVPKFLWVILAVVLFLLFAVVMMVRHPLPSSDTVTESKPIKLNFGDILDIAYNKESETVVLKVKIKSNLTKDLTVKQNYMNAWEFIKAYTDVKYKELTYWAVADMTDGTESKVIQFTVPEDAINNVLNGSILENQLGDHVTDLFLHPSLR